MARDKMQYEMLNAWPHVWKAAPQCKFFCGSCRGFCGTKTMRFGACQSSHQLCETGRQTPLAAASCAIKGLDWRGMRSFFMLPNLFFGRILCGIRYSTRFFLIFYLFRSFISFVVSKQTNDMLPSHPVLFRAKGMQKAASVRTLGPTSAEGWHTTGSSRKSDRWLDLLKRK